MNILDLAHEHFPGEVKRYSQHVYGLDVTTGEYSSVRIWTQTNTYYWYAKQSAGGPEQFLKYICGLPQHEVDEIVGDDKNSSLLSVFYDENNSKYDTGLALQDIVRIPGHNDYIGITRQVSVETSRFFELEIDNITNDVYFPLHHIKTQKRIGSLIRTVDTVDKDMRYRTVMIGTYDKPKLWPVSQMLSRYTGNQTILLVEGTWSVMRLWQCGIKNMSNVMIFATMTNRIDESIFRLFNGCNFIVIPDPDKGGKTMKYNALAKCEIATPKDRFNNPLMLDEASDKQLFGLINSIKEHTKFQLG